MNKITTSRKTKIINLYGGPGTGKSTAAAYIFCKLKTMGHNVELVREYVKNWAWEERHIGTYDQMYFLGKQVRGETLLYGKVDYIVTDSPIYLNSYYASKFCQKHINEGLQAAVQSFYAQAHVDEFQHTHIFLNRKKEYDPNGRYQSEEEAKQMDVEIKKMLDDLDVHYYTTDATFNDVMSVVEKII